MFQFLCECLSTNYVHPSVAEIIEVLNRHTVCTGTQCFESLEDIIPMQIPSTYNTEAMTQTFYFIAFVTLLALNRPRNLNLLGKPTSIRYQSNRLNEN